MNSRPKPSTAETNDVLDSWKAIATYLNREVRTVMRWERFRQLPIHRLPGGGRVGVYALKSELDLWRQGGGIRTPEASEVWGSASTPVSDLVPSVAILPFANLTARKEGEYFGDGLAEDIIAALTLLPGLRVVARTSAFAFRGKAKDVRQIGAILNVGAILEGSVRKIGTRIRVTAQLVKARDGYELWSQRFDREVMDVFAVQDEISQAIVEKLKVRLTGGQPLVRRHTDNPEAYDLLLRGRQCAYCQTPESLAKARQYLEQAVVLDPSLVLAYVGLAECHFCTGLWGLVASEEAIRRTKSEALQALSRDSSLAEAHTVLGIALGPGDFDWTGAEREFRRALELSPASPAAHSHYASFLLRPTGRLEEACREALRAVELDPLSATMNHTLGYLYYATGHHDLAVAQLSRAIHLDPSMSIPHFMLALAYARSDRFEDAITEARRACELSGRSAMALGMLGVAYAVANRQSEALAVLGDLGQQRLEGRAPPWAVAAVLRTLGRVDEMFDWLEIGVKERDLPIVCGLKSEPAYAPLRRDPRFETLLRKMNLES